MKRFVPFIALLIIAVLVACGGASSNVGNPSPQTINILSPKEGATIDNPITVQVAVTGVTLVPSKTPAAQGQGHLHILVDVDIPPAGAIVPTSPNHIHLGDATTEAKLSNLAPGPHRLTAVFADSNHKVTNPILAYTVNIIVPGPTPVPPKPGTKYP